MNPDPMLRVANTIVILLYLYAEALQKQINGITIIVVLAALSLTFLLPIDWVPFGLFPIVIMIWSKRRKSKIAADKSKE